MSNEKSDEFILPGMPANVLDEDAVYSGDNGRLFCGRHAGRS